MTHTDFKQVWMVWCGSEWRAVVNGKCSWCGKDVTDRVKGSA